MKIANLQSTMSAEARDQAIKQVCLSKENQEKLDAETNRYCIAFLRGILNKETARRSESAKDANYENKIRISAESGKIQETEKPLKYEKEEDLTASVMGDEAYRKEKGTQKSALTARNVEYHKAPEEKKENNHVLKFSDEQSYVSFRDKYGRKRIYTGCQKDSAIEFDQNGDIAKLDCKIGSTAQRMFLDIDSGIPQDNAEGYKKNLIPIDLPPNAQLKYENGKAYIKNNKPGEKISICQVTPPYALKTDKVPTEKDNSCEKIDITGEEMEISGAYERSIKITPKKENAEIGIGPNKYTAHTQTSAIIIMDADQKNGFYKFEMQGKGEIDADPDKDCNPQTEPATGTAICKDKHLYATNKEDKKLTVSINENCRDKQPDKPISDNYISACTDNDALAYKGNTDFSYNGIEIKAAGGEGTLHAAKTNIIQLTKEGKTTQISTDNNQYSFQNGKINMEEKPEKKTLTAKAEATVIKTNPGPEGTTFEIRETPKEVTSARCAKDSSGKTECNQAVKVYKKESNLQEASKNPSIWDSIIEYIRNPGILDLIDQMKAELGSL